MEHIISLHVKDKGIKTTSAFPADIVADIQAALAKKGVTDSEVEADAADGVVEHVKVKIRHAHMKREELKKIVDDYLNDKK